MVRHLFNFLVAILLVQLAAAQDLYVPRNIQWAIDNGTRTLDGLPGKNYWQNGGGYDMKIKITPETRMVSGSESIDYSNNSPDTLKTIVIRFVNNIHKPNSPRGSYASNDFLDSGLTITHFTIDGEVYDENARNWGTVGSVRLKKPILPQSHANITIDWRYPLSKQDGREGQIDSTTFYVAYSYPRVSVYDDYNGWDVLEHTGRQEFYNDFNDYTYSVTVPRNYVVYGTGDLLNPDEVLQPEFSNRLKQSYTSDNVIHIANLQEILGGKVTAQKDWNTWKFTADHITDVCFAVSKNYVWDGASVVVDPVTQRRASFQAAYNDTAKDFKQYVKWAQFSLNFFSTQWPGVPYPYSKMTAFQGHADMEYPMMVNDATTPNFSSSRLLLDHEMVHTYFPFYMGINETRYAFMDEGWATTFEYLAGIAESGKEAADNFYKSFRSGRYIRNFSSESDQPIITQSSQQAGMGYSSNSYGKASLSYLALKDLLGDVLFKKALLFYMDTWHGKHPIPWDFFNAFNKGSDQNLNWFFNNWFFTNNYVDLKVDTVQKLPDGYSISIENTGGFAIPFDIKITYADGTMAVLHQTPEVWHSNARKQIFKLSTSKPIQSVDADGGIFVDYTPGNNVFVLDGH